MHGSALRRLQLSAVLACCILFFSSCAAKKEIVRRPGVPPHAGPVTVEVLKRSIGFREITTIRALTDVRVFRNGEPEASFSGVFAYQAPDTVKTVFFGPFGLTVMEMLASRDLVQVSVPPKNTLYEAVSPGISLSSLKDDSRLTYVMQEEGDFFALYAYQASDTAAGPLMKYLFDRTYLLNRKIVVYRPEGPDIEVSFEDFNGSVPDRTRIAFGNGTELVVTLEEPEFDAAIPAEFFAPTGHDDRTVLPLQDLLRRLAPTR